MGIRKEYVLAIAFLAGGLVVSCDALFDTPEKATKEFMESMLAGDIEKIKNRICSAESAEMLKQSEAQIKLFQSVAQFAKVDLSGVNFEATVDGDTATVKASGKLKIVVSFGGQTKTQEQSMDDTRPVKLVREGGTWKICDSFGS